MGFSNVNTLNSVQHREKLKKKGGGPIITLIVFIVYSTPYFCSQWVRPSRTYIEDFSWALSALPASNTLVSLDVYSCVLLQNYLLP